MSNRAGLALLALGCLTCERPPLTSPEATITLIANPEFIPANGGVSVITAFVTEPAGTLVPDGTVVFFFTNLGRVDPQGRTRDGVTRVNLVSDSRSGTAKVSAFSGGQPAPTDDGGSAGGGASVEVNIGSALPTRVIVAADPQRIRSPRHSFITANVFDERGNPVFNVPVFFSVSANPLEETLDSGGRPVHTDTNGQAFDVLRTRAAFGIDQKEVTVTATVPAGGSTNLTATVTLAVDTTLIP